MEKFEYYTQILEDFSGSHMSAKDFCRAHGLVYKTFLRWAKRLDFNVRKKRWAKGQHPASKMQLIATNRLTHGAHQYLTTRTRQCNESCVWWSECDYAGKQEDCVVLDSYLGNVRTQILACPGINEYRDSLLIDRILKCLGFCTLIEWWAFAEGSIVKDKDGWQLAPALSSSYLAFNNTVMRGLRELGLTPTAAKGIATREPESWQTARRLAGMDNGRD